MTTEFKVPELGENVKNGDVVRVLVNAGDEIARDQPVLELETDKATIEVPSTVSGKVTEVAVKQGDKVNVGQLILRVEEGTGGAQAPSAGRRERAGARDAAQAAEAPAGAAAAEQIAAPQRGAEARTEAPRSAGAARTDGKGRARPQPAGAAEEGGLSQEATAERQPAEASPSRRSTSAAGKQTGTPEVEPDERDREEPGESGAGEEPRKAAEAAAPPRNVIDISRGSRQPAAAAEAAPVDAMPIPAAPSVRRLARELGVDVRRVQGSGPGGRISEDDVKAYVRSRPARGGEAVGLPDFTKWGEVERRPMTNVRRVTAERLTAAWAAPHVTQHDKADITALEALRTRYAPRAEAAGGKLTITAIMVKVVAEAMTRFPQFNAALDAEAGEIVYRKYVGVGIAVDTERGLLVPVIRDADRKTIVDLSVEVAAAAKKARERKLGPDDMSGGGMSITNLGGIGGTAFTPIVNAPEVAILGMSRSEMQPLWSGQSFEPRLMLPLSLSYDHRVIDGADAARFLRWVCEALEQPLLLLM